MAKAISITRVKFIQPADLDRQNQFFLDTNRNEFRHYSLTWDGVSLRVVSAASGESYLVPGANIASLKEAKVVVAE